jgi:competence protein ComEA
VSVDIAALRERIVHRAGVADRVRALVLPEAAEDASLRVRWHPSRRAAAALGLLVVVVIVVTVAWVFSSRPQSLTVDANAALASPISTASAPSMAGSTSAQSVAGDVVVDVEGKVRHPGLFRLRPGDRVNDALHAAGGVLPGVSAVGLNRAAKLTDGQQIVVGATGSVAAPGVAPVSGGGMGAAAPSAPSSVNLNSADLTQLETLPGVGPVLAQHILDWRTQHGGFARIDQLQDVTGIGPSKFAALKDAVTL